MNKYLNLFTLLTDPKNLTKPKSGMSDPYVYLLMV